MKKINNSCESFITAVNNKHKILIILLLCIAILLLSFSLLPNFQDRIFGKVIDFCSWLLGEHLNHDEYIEKILDGSKDSAIAILLGTALWYMRKKRGKHSKLSKKQENTICCTGFILFSIITLVTIFLHEPWIDEVHAWFLAKEYSVSRLIYEMRYEGHFILWYLILMPFAKHNFPIITLNIISWFISCISVAFFLWKSPFTLSAKLVALCSNALLFWYPVVSRCYVLLIPLLFMLASIYKKRNERLFLFAILLAMLSNTHAYIEGFVGVLTFSFLIQDIILPWKQYSIKEKKNHLIAFAIIILGILIAFLQVAPAFFAKDKNEAANFHFDIISLTGFLTGSNIFLFATPFFAAFFIFVLFYIYQTDKKQFLILFFSLVYMGLFSVCLYAVGIPNRALMWFFILIFVLWNTRISNTRKSVLLIICALFIMRPSLTLRDWKEDFSSLKTTKKYIENNYKEETPIFIKTTHYTATFAVTLADNFTAYHLESMNPVKLYSFSRKYNPHKAASVPDHISNIENSKRFSFPILIISEEQIPHAEIQSYKYHIKEFPCVYARSLWLYVLKKDDAQIP